MKTVQGTISIVSHGHGVMVRHLLKDLASQAGIENWLVVMTLNIPEPFEDDVPGLRMHVIRNSDPKGFGANHNAAAAYAEGPLFAIVNPDIRMVANDTLDQIAGLDWSGRPVLRAPVVVAPDGAHEDSVRRNLSVPNLIVRARSRRTGWEGDPDSGDFFWLAGMFLIVPLARFRALDGFDEQFRLYCEDFDLCARWRIAGGGVELVRGIRVVHDARRDSHRSFRHLRWHLASLMRVWRSGPFWRIVTGRYDRSC